MPSLGSRLRNVRAQARLTQAELAARAGVSRALVSAIEAGRHLPRVDAALSLARALGTTTEALFGPEDGARRDPVDVLSGDPPAPGAAVRVALVGERVVCAAPRLGDEGWDVADGIAGALERGALSGTASSVVLAGCEPALVLLERILREDGTRALSVGASSAAAIAALRDGRVHLAAVHFPSASPPPASPVPILRIRFARWRVGLAAPRGSRRNWWTPALGGRVAVIQREPGAAAQEAFERARRRRRSPVEGPRVATHLAAARRCIDTGLPAVTIEPAAAAVGAAFHPLETHDVELWIAEEHAAEPGVQRLLDLAASGRFRRALEDIGGYDLSGSGTRVA